MTKRVFSLEALKQQFADNGNTNENRSNGNYYPFWDMDFGKQAIVRFLPDKSPEHKYFLVEKKHHELIINGEKRKVSCLKNYKEDCPICNESQKFYKTEGQNSEAGRQLYMKRQYLGQVLVIDDPIAADSETGVNSKGEVKLVTLGAKIYKSIKDAIESNDLDAAPQSYEEGTNFIIKKNKDGNYADYSLSRFERKPSPIDESLIDMIEEKLVDLHSLMPANPGYNALQQLLNDHLYGTDESKILSSPSVATQYTEEKAILTTEPVKMSADLDEEDEAQKLLAQIRERRSKIAE